MHQPGGKLCAWLANRKETENINDPRGWFGVCNLNGHRRPPAGFRAGFVLFLAYWGFCMRSAVLEKNAKKNTLSTRGCTFLAHWAREECPTRTHHTLNMGANTFLVAIYTLVKHNTHLYVHIVYTMNWTCQNTSDTSAKTTEKHEKRQKCHEKYVPLVLSVSFFSHFFGNFLFSGLNTKHESIL